MILDYGSYGEEGFREYVWKLIRGFMDCILYRYAGDVVAVTQTHTCRDCQRDSRNHGSLFMGYLCMKKAKRLAEEIFQCLMPWKKKGSGMLSQLRQYA